MLDFDFDNKNFSRMKRNLAASKSFAITGLTSFLRLLLVQKIKEFSDKKVLFITASEQTALKCQNDLKNAFEIDAEIFPFQSTSMYEPVSANLYDYAAQIELLNSDKDLIVPVKALLEKFPDKKFFEKNSIYLKIGDEIDTKKLAQNLINLGYKRSTMASDMGEFSIRGDIIDVFSLSQNPFRIELWGDEIVDLRIFDNQTQKSIEKVKEITIKPVYKFIFDKSINKRHSELVSESHPLSETKIKLEEGYFEGIEVYQNYFNPDLVSIFDYFNPSPLPSPARGEGEQLSSHPSPFTSHLIVFDEMSEIFSKYEFIAQNYQNQLGENIKTGLIFYPSPLPPLPQGERGKTECPKNSTLRPLMEEINVSDIPPTPRPLREREDFQCEERALENRVRGNLKNHFELEEFQNQTASFIKIGFNNFIDYDCGDLTEFDSQPLKGYFSGIDEITDFISSKKGYKILVATDFPERVKEIFAQKNLFDFETAKSLSCSGCIIEDLKLILLTDKELFNKRPKEITASKRAYYKEKPEFIESINDIKEGEFVVHSIHGVGVYKGISQQQLDGQYKDYLTIEYALGDKLHMPAEQINLLCRYRGSGTLKPKLSRMGGSDWENTKTRVKKEVEKIAYDLLRLYAKRKIQEGIVFEQDNPWQFEMEEAFEYTETPDQMKSILEVKSDMENEIPMDRLICGDVGFGKTEVAIRAIFKAVTSGYQAAVIVPTTILALQHFQTIQERFKPFGIKVELLSRFKSAKEQKQILKELTLGSIDVVIATHRLLQGDVHFKNLGLLVIDEEHRFGVRHKEKLKSIKENIDIISMSATPIPRTLYMSLSGIKDMSVINTPPKNRLPIKTFVGEFNESQVKNAIVHELDREGQVFYLYNRVETIEEFKLQLQKIVPEAKIQIGHAQMDEKQLEKVMVNFANKEFDILLCTTIIESGLDIPNANTIIIHDCDKFGLAQLYQLRGRVGRSERQAYCWCFYKKSKELTQEAIKRLKAIKEFTTLGSGYQIALRDIEIRGIGNILGTKQHGHMVNVGFDTYCQLLEETINELKGESTEKIP
ncbi:MAG TPA: transcription-repair coupling factor, partial [Candidatus Gastranaerophilaceae bacterium]|nr:transcription-repair coupling factor [Candidatus Gastranaerophilaceae bacterium]